MKYHRTACPNDISKACLQTAYWEIQLKEKGDEGGKHTGKWQEWEKEQNMQADNRDCELEDNTESG